MLDKVSTAALSASSPYPAVLHDPQASTSSSYVTPALSAKVQLAAETNPTLANLLNAVINHVATDEEVKRLGVLIRQLEDIPDLGSPGIPPPSPTPPIPARAVSPKPFDLILEFHEKPSDRWTLPRGDVFCERVGVAEGAWARYADVIITTCITPSGGPSEPATSDEPLPDSLAPDVVSLRFSRVPQSLWELLVDWAGGPQKMESSKAKLVDIVGIPSTLFATSVNSVQGECCTAAFLFAVSRTRRRAVSRAPECEQTKQMPSLHL